jgi:hypothetical protein
MNYDKIIDYAAGFSEKEFEKYGNDITKCPRVASVVHLVIMAQGVIDNGGLIYFFENNWPGLTYDQFIDAYNEIGCPISANKIMTAKLSFGLPNVESDVDGRRKFMESNKGEDGHIFGWGKDIYGAAGVYESLARYVIKNKSFFGEMDWE